MARNIWIGTGIGLAAGLAIGYWIGSTRPAGPMAPTAPPATSGPVPVWTPGTSELQQVMFQAQQAVERNPKDLGAWITLGNGYFDSHQPQKAIDAYGKALELAPRNPDLLTDQGIMYRELNAFDKAIACFEQANKIDPKHMQSLYNLGIVYAHDMKAPDKAIQLWTRIITTAPGSPQAELSRKAIEEIRANPHHS